MADDESDSQSTTSKGKSTKVNFVLLKHILEDDSSDFTDLEEETDKNEGDQSKQGNKKTKEDQNCGPVGRYPVLFSKRCKSKSCQTRLSAFPLFPLPEDTEWLSEDEEIQKRKRVVEKRRRRRRNSSESKFEKKKAEEILEKAPEKTKNPDGSRIEFTSEHQLKETKNPIIQAWIQRKNKLSRKTRREERKEKKAQRAAVEEEERLKSERYEKSETKVKEWFKIKRKEAKKLWRQNHPRVSPFDMSLDEQTENTPPPPEYKVVKTFKQNHSKARRASSASFSSNVIPETVNKFTSANSGQNVHQTKQPTIRNTAYSKSFDMQSAGDSSRGIERPQTAHNLRSTKNKTPTRPKTAKAKSNATKESTNSKSLDDSSKQMNSLSYDDWLKSKRTQDKKKIVDRRRELTDSHLETVISKLGKQRVDNIVSSKKQIDTGLKNFSRSSTRSPPAPKSQYKWKNSHDLPRPEPQGCDCPEAEHLDTDSPIHSESKYIPLSPLSQRKKADEFCEEVSQKCDELKPSIDKVLAVLDSEMKKCSANDKKPSKTSSTSKTSSLLSTTNATCNDTVDIDLSLPGTVDEGQPQPRPKSVRPTSARPKSNLVNNTSLTRKEAKQKIFHDMDILGLCHSDENLGNAVAKKPDKTLGNTVAKRLDENLGSTVAKRPDGNLDEAVARTDITESMSTVRSNYFDYGTDVDVTNNE